MSVAQLAPPVVDRSAIIDWYLRTRDRSRRLFDLLDPAAYYDRPIALRHPIVFYEGHLTAFSFNTLVKRALGRPGLDPHLERLFARGIDPDDSGAAARSGPEGWPSRDEVREFVARADALVLRALSEDELDRSGHPLLDAGQAVYAIIEHEAMHQETLLYMWHRLPLNRKRAPTDPEPVAADRMRAPRAETIAIPSGRVTLGARPGEIPFGWDNEFDAFATDVAGFAIDRFNVTNAQFLEFVDAGGYRDPRWWTPAAFEWVRETGAAAPPFWVRRESTWMHLGMFGERALPDAWPVYVSQAEADAYARWKGRRLPTEAEFHQAAYAAPDGRQRQYPWGDEPPDASRGNFDFRSWDPEPVGSRPAGRSAWGVDDLVGNGWEWTSTVFGPFPGFRPLASYPEYSADFFDGQHFVMKGASPATSRELLRRTFRNWFRPHYPHVYATFRTVA